MKTISIKLLIIIVLCVLFSVSINAQNNSSSGEIKRNIETAFTNFKLRDTLAIEPELEKELKKSYYQALISLKPDNFRNANMVNALKQYYSTPTGIEYILSQWMRNTGSNSDKIFSVGDYLFMKIDFISRNPDAEFLPTSPRKYDSIKPSSPSQYATRPTHLNKYATIIIINEPKNLGSVGKVGGKD